MQQPKTLVGRIKKSFPAIIVKMGTEFNDAKIPKSPINIYGIAVDKI